LAVPRPAPESEQSAGGVLWRPGSEPAEPELDAERAPPNVEVCLIATRGSSRWQLPKGHVSGAETLAEAARREVREETGCDGVIEDDLGSIVFWFYVGSGARRKRVRKTVQFFLLRYQKGDTADHDGEVDEAMWLSADAAVRRLTFESERQILLKGLGMLRARRRASPSATSA